MKKSTGRPAQVVLSRQKLQNSKNETSGTGKFPKSLKETTQVYKDAQQKWVKKVANGTAKIPKHLNETAKIRKDAQQKLTKLKKRVNKAAHAHQGKDNLAMSDVSTDSGGSSEEEVDGRKVILTIDCGTAGSLDDIGFQVMGGRAYDDDDYDDPGIYVQEVTEGHAISNTVEAGDQVTKIAGHSVHDVPLHHAVNLLRAAHGRTVINIVKHPDNKLGAILPEDSDDDSGPATSIQLDDDDFDEVLNHQIEAEDTGIPCLNAGIGEGLIFATLAVPSFEPLQTIPRSGSCPGSTLGMPKGILKNGSVAGSSRAGSSHAGSQYGSVEDGQTGSISSTLQRDINVSSSAVDETDGGEEVEVGFFSGRPGQLDELDFEFAGGRDDPFVPRNGGIFITKVKFGSVLEEHISPGDKIIRLEGIDVSNVPQYAFVNLIRASHGKATMTLRKAIKQKVNASVFDDDIEVSVNALGAKDELIVELKTGPKGRRGQIGFKITGGRDKPCMPGDPGVFVKSVKPGSKVEKILRPGDKLLKVDGKNVTQATQGQVMDLIRKADTRVLLHIKRSLLEEDEERLKGKSIGESFDAEQVEEFLAAFEMYSSPINKRMRIGDLSKLCRALGFNLTGQDYEAMITKFKHKNENQTDVHWITFPEFLIMITDFSLYLQKDADIMEAFEIFDRERSGFFLLEDLKLAFKYAPGHESIDEEEIQEIMEKADSNGDGKVYYQDFKDLVLPIFHKY